MPTFRELRRSLGNWLAITRNRIRGRTYAPHPRRMLVIEPSGRCNLACRFCAYDQAGPGQLMKMDAFQTALREAIGMGFEFIYLTPSLGEAFADPTLFDKLDLMEQEPGIRGYGFYTNFVLPDAADIRRLAHRPKFNALHISLYGFDEASFIQTTRKPARQFERLLHNLETLFQAAADWQPAGGLHFNVRTVRTGQPFLEMSTPMAKIVRRFLDERGARFDEADEYDNWGGTISDADVASLGITLTDGRNLYMRGACTKLFGEIQIKANGTVHACACRDVDGSLRIGQLGSAPLAEILSWDNPAYRRLIEDQMQGRFGPNCRSCSSYRSVFDDRASRNNPELEVMSVADAVSHLLPRPGKP